MLLSQHLKKEAISLDLKGRNMNEILEELADIIAEEHKELHAEGIRNDLISREKLLSTALGDGVALPHCYYKVKSPKFALGISKIGVEAEAPDSKPVRLFVVVVSPENSPDEHLEALSAASRLFVKKDFREQLLLAQDSAQVLEIIKNLEHEVNG